MIRTQRFRNAAGPAQSARMRLLNDPAMRRNTSQPALAHAASGSAPVTFAPMSAELIRPHRAAGEALSRREQERRARQVAASFRQHTLTELRYEAGRQMVVATIQPRLNGGKTEAPHRICVEANGNVSVLHYTAAAVSPDEHLMLGRVLMLATGLCALIGTLVSFII